MVQLRAEPRSTECYHFAVFARPGQCGQCNEDLLCVIESVLELADLQHFTDFTDLTIYFTLEG